MSNSWNGISSLTSSEARARRILQEQLERRQEATDRFPQVVSFEDFEKAHRGFETILDIKGGCQGICACCCRPVAKFNLLRVS